MIQTEVQLTIETSVEVMGCESEEEKEEGEEKQE